MADDKDKDKDKTKNNEQESQVEIDEDLIEYVEKGLKPDKEERTKK